MVRDSGNWMGVTDATCVVRTFELAVGLHADHRQRFAGHDAPV